MSFAHLRVHTNFSVLNGVSTPEQYIKKAKEYDHKAIAITEYGWMSSVPDAYFACKDAGIKYIPGCVLYFNDYIDKLTELQNSNTNVNELRRTDLELFKRINENRNITVLCKNEIGFKNLIELTTLSYHFGLYNGRPRVSLQKLLEYKEGLILLSGGLNGPIEHELYLNISNIEFEGCPYNRSEIDKNYSDYIKIFKSEFGDDFYFELQMPCMPELYDDKIFQLMLKLGEKYNVKSIITNNCYYINKEDFEVQRLMCAIDQGTDIYDPSLIIQDTDHFYYKSESELRDTFLNNKYSKNLTEEKFDECCNVIDEIVDKIEPLKIDSSPKIPDWSEIEIDKNSANELKRLVAESLVKKGLHKSDKRFRIDGREVSYVEQANIECNRFIKKGFASYFLITRDLVSYGKSRGWPFGPRGSCGGSLVCYLLGITYIDPCLWSAANCELSFDRFLANSRGGYMLKVGMD